MGALGGLWILNLSPVDIKMQNNNDKWTKPEVQANVKGSVIENGSRWNIKISTQLVLLEKIIWGSSRSLPQMKVRNVDEDVHFFWSQF